MPQPNETKTSSVAEIVQGLCSADEVLLVPEQQSRCRENPPVREVDVNVCRLSTSFGYCSSAASLTVWPRCVNARRIRCQADLNSFPLEELEETTGTPLTTWMKTTQQDLESLNLFQNEESSTLGNDVYVWCCTLVVVHPEMNGWMDGWHPPCWVHLQPVVLFLLTFPLSLQLVYLLWLCVFCTICFSRLYDVACDAELHEKSKSDLVRVTNLVIDRCRQTVANYESQAGSFFLLHRTVLLIRGKYLTQHLELKIRNWFKCLWLYLWFQT